MQGQFVAASSIMVKFFVSVAKKPTEEKLRLVNKYPYEIITTDIR